MKWFRNIRSGAVEAWPDDSARAAILALGDGPDGPERRDHEEVTPSGNGGSLPSQWTTDDKGNLRIQSDGSGNGLGWNGLSGIIIRSSTSANDALVITDENGNAVILIDPFGTFAGSYLALSGNNSGAGAKIAAIEGGDIASAAFDYLEVDAAGTYLFRIQADGSTTIFDATGVAAFKVAADGSVHIRTGTSIIADL